MGEPTSTSGQAASKAPRGFWNRTFLTLAQYRDYRLLWLGSTSEHLGDWMEQAAVLWIIYQISGSAIYLALHPMARMLPLIFLSPVGGMVADHTNRRNLVIYSFLGKAVLSVALLVLVRTGAVQVWHILLIALLGGVTTAFNHPARHTLIPNMVKKEHLLNAITLDNTSVTASRVVGMPIAGFLIAWFGAGSLLGVRTLSCLLAAILLVPVQVPSPPAQQKRSRWKELIEGFSYVKGHSQILAQVCMYFFSYFATQGYSSFLPVFASNVFKVGPQGYGLLNAAPGLGALFGLFTLATVVDFRRKGLYLFVSGGVMTLAVFLFSSSPWFIVALVFLVLTGAMNNTFQTVNNTIIQSQIPDTVRGRVMSLREVISGLGPLSGILVGYLSNYLGVQRTVSIVSLGFFGVIVLLAFLLPGVRKFTS